MKGYYARKIHSLLGVIPLSFFILEHVVTNFGAFEGGLDKFNEGVAFLNGLPFVLFMELFLIWLPLLYHGVFGLYIAYQSKPNTGSYNYERNWRFLLQRVTGVLTFMFVIWHVYETRVQVALGNVTHEELGGIIHAVVMNPFTFILYLIGVISTAFHFSNGIWSFLVSWGITVGPRAQRVSSIMCMGLFAIVSVLFVLSLIAFRDVEFKSVMNVIESLKTVLS
jgi:succinate dehydrogenase / fumarate reductase cytochrome b subunit